MSDRIQPRYINPSFFTGLYLPDWLLDLDLSNNARVCYAKLARLAQKKGHAYPKIDELATALGCSTPRIHAHIKELKDIGLIQIVRTGRRNNFYLLWHPIMEAAGELDLSEMRDRKSADVSKVRDQIIPKSDISDVSKVRDPIIDRKQSEKSKKENKGSLLELTDYWCERYREVTGNHYAFTSRDGIIFARLLKQHGIKEVQRVIELLLNTKDDYIKTKMGYTAGVLSNQWNKLVSTAARTHTQSDGTIYGLKQWTVK